MYVTITYIIQFKQKPILRRNDHLNFAAQIQTMRKWQQLCLNVLSADKTYVASDSFYVWAYTDSTVFFLEDSHHFYIAV